MPATDYWRAVQTLHRLGRDAAAFFTHCDVYLTPVVAAAPFPANPPQVDSVEALFAQNMTHAPFTGIHNATGCPAMSIPAGLDDAGLPVGVQIIAPQGAEPLLFALAAEIERTRPWPKLAPLDERRGLKTDNNAG